jgi:uncharacterized repeat protein (TIGR03843 family)
VAENPIRAREAIDDQLALTVLNDGEMDILGRMPWSSNATFLVDLEHPDGMLQAIYKPHRGERPLWDFPSGLYRRERAAYVLSAVLGWDLVPPTVLRDGALGVGSLQLVVPCDYEEHFFTLVEDPAHHAVLRRLCLFDVVANSTDRKAGHCLLGTDGAIYAIDNGLSFHEEFKLRTVIWNWGGEPLPVQDCDDLLALIDAGLPDELGELLDRDEIDAIESRIHRAVSTGVFPIDHSGHRYPWPLV